MRNEEYKVCPIGHTLPDQNNAVPAMLTVIMLLITGIGVIAWDGLQETHKNGVSLGAVQAALENGKERDDAMARRLDGHDQELSALSQRAAVTEQELRNRRPPPFGQQMER